MRVLVVGGLGSIGSRYVSILNYLKHDPVIYDTSVHEVVPGMEEYEKAIIATPTDKHFFWAAYFGKRNIPFLCEKPLSKEEGECKLLVDYNGFVVNNYAYLCGTKQPKIEYDYFRTGKDGTLFDCCQLVYLDPSVQIKTDSPIWRLKIDEQPISYLSLEYSYINMISDFVNGAYNNLWTMKQGYEMTAAVLNRMGNENRNLYTS